MYINVDLFFENENEYDIIDCFNIERLKSAAMFANKYIIQSAVGLELLHTKPLYYLMYPILSLNSIIHLETYFHKNI